MSATASKTMAWAFAVLLVFSCLIHEADAHMVFSLRMLTQMLVVDPDSRLTANQAMLHPWFMKGDHELVTRSLEATLSTMRTFNAKRKLKGTVKTVMMANRLGKGTF